MSDDNGSATTPSDWKSLGAVCASGLHSPDLWFGESKAGIELAKMYCGVCPVRTDCLVYAVDNGISPGVWGGLTAEERYKWKKKYAMRRIRSRQPVSA